VFVKDYRRIGDPWKSLGRTPLDKVRVPLVFCRWKIGLTDYETAEGALMASVESYPLVLDVKLDKQGALPKGMVHVAGGKFKPDLDGLNQEAVAELELSDFLLDRCEVSNRQFKEFVKAGGYTKPEYWMHKFTQENRELAWEEAMKLLVDKTGRRGPATWEFADYPQGQDDHPVTGVSWFEAAAYAEWAGKNLPTVYEWTLAAMGFIQPEAFKLAGLHRPYYVGFVIALSNFGGKGPTPGGTFHGVSARGIYDMAGNVKEWCLNETTNGQRFTLGGAWNEQLYTFYSTDFYAPLMREANFGFRCMKSLAQNEASILAARPLAPWSSPSRGDQKPCSDEVFEAYQRLYTYKKSDLNPKVEQRQDLTPYTRLEKVSFDAAYGNERMVAYLFIPRTGQPPFQTIVHYPGAGAWTLPKFEDCGFAADAEYRTKTGRAFVVPVLKDTFERRLPPEKRGSTGCEVCILCAKDVMRTIDYLEMRPEFDTNKFIYEGLSLGAIWGGIIPAVERRFKVAVMFAGGLRAGMPPDHSQINFAPRITIPVLMQNGRYDSAFPLETSVKPLLALIATPEKDKYLKVYESGHSVWKLNEFLKDEFNFLDQYLGPPR
jgi:formylglycine-generating enzyme required for sulfatase activity/dienelactone hydrolase